jgi:hypothetical protein
MNHKFWIIVSFQKDILHIGVPWNKKVWGHDFRKGCIDVKKM